MGYAKLVRWVLGALSVCVFCIAGCRVSSTPQAAAPPAGSSYFKTPQEAVEKASVMLRAGDWRQLSDYYDLSDGHVTRAELESGEFFTRTERPTNAAPGDLWKYKHPFAPGFKYQSHESVAEVGVVQVTVVIQIDQGGGPPQRGFSTFVMRENERGFQFLPRTETTNGSSAPSGKTGGDRGVVPAPRHMTQSTRRA